MASLGSMRPLLYALAGLAVIYLLLIAAAWAWQERIVWQPPSDAPPGVGTRIDFSAEDGQPLYALVVGDPVRAKGLVIAFHGNAEVAAWNVDWATELARRTGWAVMLAEYRGYGGLPGSPSHGGALLDARATWRAARERLGVDSARIALYGHSLGTAVAAALASEHAPAALVLLAPFTSMSDMVRGFGGRPLAAAWPLIGRVGFDTRARVAELDAVVSVAHGEQDRVIPVAMGRAVHAAARRKGELLTFPGAGHNDVLAVAPQPYWKWLARALAGASANPISP